MESVAHHPERQADMDVFFSDAATGNLPAFAWINPRSGVNVTTGEGSNDQHPDHDVALGEQLMKVGFKLTFFSFLSFFLGSGLAVSCHAPGACET